MRDLWELCREFCKAMWQGLIQTREVKWYWFAPQWLCRILCHLGYHAPCFETFDPKCPRRNET